ncbi:MAG: hypothetical protein ACK5O1_01515 [Holosporales bacterium]|jgi:hypothetical protein
MATLGRDDDEDKKVLLVLSAQDEEEPFAPVDAFEDACHAAGWELERLSDTVLTVSIPYYENVFSVDITFDMLRDYIQIVIEVAAIPFLFANEERRATLKVFLHAINNEVESGSFSAYSNSQMFSFVSFLSRRECQMLAYRERLAEILADYITLSAGYKAIFALFNEITVDDNNYSSAVAGVLHLLKPLGNA